MKILVVEDDKISSLYLSKIVKPYGDCDISESGDMALEKIQNAFEENSKYDVIFLDIMLPKLSGQKLLELIRAYDLDYDIKEEDRTIIIMTTVYKDAANITTAYSNMVDSYLIKPILKQTVDEIFKKIIKSGKGQNNK